MRYHEDIFLMGNIFNTSIHVNYYWISDFSALIIESKLINFILFYSGINYASKHAFGAKLKAKFFLEH